MRNLIAAFDKQLERVSRLFAIVGALGIVVLLGVTVVAVFWRYILDAPIFGIEDVSIVTLTVVAAGAVAYGGRHGAHVSIDLISSFLGRKATRITDSAMRLAVAATCFLATYALITKACGLEKACITSNISIVHRPFFYVLAAAMAFYGLHMTLRLIIGLTDWHAARDPNEVSD